MSGRHAAHIEPRSRSRWPRRVGVAVLTVVVLTAGGLIARAFLDTSSEGRCDGPQALSVVADPTISAAVNEAAETYSADEACIDITVTAQESAETMADLATSEADLWIPDSTLWRTKLPDPDVVNSIGSIASSPLVAVAPRSVAEERMGWPDGEFSWSAALEADAGAAVADPSSATEGVTTLLAVQAALGGSASQTEMVRTMAAVAESTVPSVGEAYEVVGAEGGPVVFTATEQSVVQHNQSNPKVPVAALYPAEGTLALDYPALVVSDSERAEDATAFAEYLSRNQKEIVEAGFRDRNDEIGVGQDMGVLSQAPDLLPTPDADAIRALNRQWSALSLEMRMLAVIDISGSMAATADDGGPSRVDLTRDAAQTALGILRKSSQVGMWVFSAAMDGDQDYAELVDVGALDEVNDDGNTRLEVLNAAAETLPERVETELARPESGTALYDTALAAFREVRSTYEPGKVNSVVLMTDGVNEGDPNSIEFDELLTTLQAEYNPQEPVYLITIGIGPDVDMTVLNQISQATGTSAYQAEDPGQIQQVFLQAMIERQCRPNCD